MILYNTTVKVDHDINDEFLQWVKKHFAEAMATGLVTDVSTFRLLGVDIEDGMTYSLQYKLPDLGTYDKFIIVIDSVFKKDLHERYGMKQISFSSVLQML
jgi:hypothetical protein